MGDETKADTPSAPGGHEHERTSVTPRDERESSVDSGEDAAAEPAAHGEAITAVDGGEALGAEHHGAREAADSVDPVDANEPLGATDQPDAPDAGDTEDAVDALGAMTDSEGAAASAVSSTSPAHAAYPDGWQDDSSDDEATVNLTGSLYPLPGRDDLDEPTKPALSSELDDALRTREEGQVARSHLKGLLEALIFASDSPIRTHELAKSAAAAVSEVKDLLDQLLADYRSRGMQLAEVAGGWLFRTNASYAPFVRDLTKQKPVRLSRAQIETLAILAYRQPITRPEVDEIRGVDSGATLKLLLERELVKILGKKDEPGRPLLYGTTPAFLELFSLKSLKDLPTLREFTELNEDSRRVVERELGETMAAGVSSDAADTVAPPPAGDVTAFEDPESVAEVTAEPSEGEELASGRSEVERAPHSDVPENPKPSPDDAEGEDADEFVASLEAGLANSMKPASDEEFAEDEEDEEDDDDFDDEDDEDE